MEDGKIIELFFDRSEQAITELSGKYGTVCVRIAENILHNKSDAEECVSDAYLAVWNTVPPQKPEPLLSYVCRIVRNQALKRYHANTAEKRNSYYDVALDEIADCFAVSSTVEEELDAGELAAKLDGFLESLDRDSRVLFVRRYWYSDPIDGLAKRFQTSAHNISVRLSRIRKKLKKYLNEGGISQ